MKKDKIINISYKEYNSIEELSEDDRILAQSAIQTIPSAYAPYSNFRVGAAVRMSGGSIAIGTNQENAAFPSGICAEKVAISSAFSSFPEECLKAIAIAAKPSTANEVHPESLVDGLTLSPLTPCGSCRDVLMESQRRSGEPVRVICVGKDAIWVVDGIENLLPLGFKLK